MGECFTLLQKKKKMTFENTFVLHFVDSLTTKAIFEALRRVLYCALNK